MQPEVKDTGVASNLFLPSYLAIQLFVTPATANTSSHRVQISHHTEKFMKCTWNLENVTQHGSWHTLTVNKGNELTVSSVSLTSADNVPCQGLENDWVTMETMEKGNKTSRVYLFHSSRKSL